MKRKKFISDPVFGGKYLKAKKNLTITKSPQILKMLKMIVLSNSPSVIVVGFKSGKNRMQIQSKGKSVKIV